MSEVIREVQAGQTIELTYRGKAVALLTPVPNKNDRAERQAALARLAALAAEIAARTPGPVDITQVLGEIRRH